MARGKNEAKITFTADTSEFTAKVKAADGTMRQLRSEMRLNAAQMKTTGASAEALAESKRILAEQERALGQKVEALTGKLRAAEATWGANSAEAQRYAVQLNNAKVQQENVRAAIDKATQAIEEQARAEAESRSAYSMLNSEISEQRQRVSQLEREYADAALAYGENSRACQDLRSELSRAGAELRQSEGRLKRAEDAARGLSRGLDDAGDSASRASVSLGDLAAADFLSDAAQSLIGTLLELSEETVEYTAAQERLDAAFENSGRTADDARGVYQDFLGILGDSDQAVEAAQDMNNLADAGADFDSWYTIAAGTASAFGDALPIESLIESANESIRTGRVVGGLADALNWTSVSADDLNDRLGSDHPEAMSAFVSAQERGLSAEDAMNAALAACSTEQERQQVLTEVLSSQYDELGESFLSASEDIDEARRAEDDLKNAQAELARDLLPLKTDLTQLATAGFGFLRDHMAEVSSIAAMLATAFAALKVAMLMQSAPQQLASVLNFVKMGLAGLSPPVLVVSAAIAALVGAFTWAYQSVEPFRAAVDQLVQQLQLSLGPVLEQIGTLAGQFLTGAMTWLADMITLYVVPAIAQFGTFLTETVFPVLQQFSDWFSVNILPVLQSLWGFITESVLPLFQQFADFVLTVVVPAIASLWTWFSANVLPILQQIWGFVSANILPIFGQLAGFITGTVVPAVQDLWGWLSANILPVLRDVWGFVNSSILPIFGQLAGFVTGTLVPAISDLWGWFSANVLPILQQVWGFVSANILPIFGRLAGFVTGTLVPAIGSLWGWFSSSILPILRDVWGFISSSILPIFGQFAGFITGTVIPAVSSLWGWFSSNILPVIEDVGGKVQWVMDRFGELADFIGGLRIEFPHFDLPHLKFSGEFSLIPPKVPDFWIEWYAKGAVLKKPTIFGSNGGVPMAGGEAGPEAVAPIGVLQGYVSEAVARANGDGARMICDAIGRLGERVTVLEVNGRQIATAMAGDADRVNGHRQNLARRGLAL